MYRVYAAKQVGDVSYFVGDLNILKRIILGNQIQRSNHEEYNPRTKKKQHYISLSRNHLAAAGRNPTRWRYGLLLDGNKLSNYYHIEPFSYIGSNINRGTSIRIKELVSYDDNTYILRLVNWPAMPVTENTFRFLESLILDADDTFNREHKLVVQNGGKRRVNGHLIDTKYMYNVQHGDGGRLLAAVDDIPREIKTFLTKSPKTNEYEERIWLKDKEMYLSISGCIKGIFLPEDEIGDFETSTDPDVIAIRDALDKAYRSYDIVYY